MANQTDVLRAHQLPELLDYAAVSTLLGVSLSTLRRLIADKVLPVVYTSPRRPRIRIEDVAAYRLSGVPPFRHTWSNAKKTRVVST